MDSDQQTLHFRRAVIRTGVWAGIGAAIPGALVLSYWLYRWLHPGPAPANRFHDFMSDLVYYWPYPVSGCAVFLACAAWATYAPPGSWRFSRSLLIIFGISVASWFLVGLMDNLLGLHLLNIYKGEEQTLRLSQALVLYCIPGATAQALVAIRHWRTK